MKGLMQKWPLVVPSILDYAGRWHPEQQVVCRTAEGPTVVSTYADLHRRAQLCTAALRKLGVGRGTVVATLAWNTTRHLESWYGIIGAGGVCHTLNPRLSLDDLTYISRHAGDVVLLADECFANLAASIADACPLLSTIVLLTDREHMPRDVLPDALCYEELLGSCVSALPVAWETVDEDDACGMCYTSGTTGRPKGVVYSHRSNWLHAMAVLLPDSLALTARCRVLAAVPLFHANAWGLAFAAPLAGAALLLPGPALDAASIYGMMETYQVNISAAVPTVWLGLLAHVRAKRLRFSTLRLVVVGGAPATLSLISEFSELGVELKHLWGMTELSPVGTYEVRKGAHALPDPHHPDSLQLKVAQGRPHPLCDMRLVDDDGRVLPHDGETMGHLQVRGAVVVSDYYGAAPGSTCVEGGWFSTGDVASIDALGVLRITDRSKDVIKTGGEWVSSLALENAVSAHPAVAEAAAVGVPHDKWGERPLVVVVLKHEPEDPAALRAELLGLLASKVARYAVPDDLVFVASIPHNATGKVAKAKLREQYQAHLLPRAKL